MLNIFLGNSIILTKSKFNLSEINLNIHSRGLSIADYYLVHNGQIITSESNIECGDIHIVLRTYGGKGGFGSMLRAIGAQIEKTTNREACRDLSGRRLRDINEEKRLKKWITQQAEREKEAAERKQKKLEKLCEKPKHEFRDNEYDKERSQLPVMVEDALVEGLKKASSTVAVKRKINDNNAATKKRKLWIDDDVEDVSSSDEEESDGDDTKQSSVESSESNSSDTLTKDNSENGETESKKSEAGKENPSENSSTSAKNSDEETHIEVHNTNILQNTV